MIPTTKIMAAVVSFSFGKKYYSSVKKSDTKDCVFSFDVLNFLWSKLEYCFAEEERSSIKKAMEPYIGLELIVLNLSWHRVCCSCCFHRLFAVLSVAVKVTDHAEQQCCLILNISMNLRHESWNNEQVSATICLFTPIASCDSSTGLLR